MSTPYEQIPRLPLHGPADPVVEAEAATYDALCQCDDTSGDNPFCPVCEPDGGM